MWNCYKAWWGKEHTHTNTGMKKRSKRKYHRNNGIFLISFMNFRKFPYFSMRVVGFGIENFFPHKKEWKNGIKRERNFVCVCVCVFCSMKFNVGRFDIKSGVFYSFFLGWKSMNFLNFYWLNQGEIHDFIMKILLFKFSTSSLSLSYSISYFSP